MTDTDYVNVTDLRGDFDYSCMHIKYVSVQRCHQSRDLSEYNVAYNIKNRKADILLSVTLFNQRRYHCLLHYSSIILT